MVPEGTETVSPDTAIDNCASAARVRSRPASVCATYRSQAFTVSADGCADAGADDRQRARTVTEVARDLAAPVPQISRSATTKLTTVSVATASAFATRVGTCGIRKYNPVISTFPPIETMPVATL